MNRTEILKGIYDHHGEAGLFFSPDYKRLSPSYGIDNPCMEYRGLSAGVDKMIDVLSCKESITKDNVVEAFKIAVRPSVVLRKYRAEFENACDDLYYGYGYKFWREHNNGIDNEEDAKLVWGAAFNKMAKA